MKSIFNQEIANEVIARIDKLSPEVNPQWGKMSVDQMFAHCNVPYEMVYIPEKFKKPGAVGRFFIKFLAKNQVVGPKPYPKNGRTAPDFIIKDKRNFEVEKKRLVDFINKTAELGGASFEGKESFAMGALTEGEWNMMFHKHIDHHLRQFGV